jgi:hypothetical protein
MAGELVESMTRYRDDAIASLDTEQARALLDLLETAPDDRAQFAAVSLLATLSGLGDDRMPRTAKARFAMLVARIAREYPTTFASRCAFSAWRELDGEAARRFLLTLEIGSLPTNAGVTAIRDLVTMVGSAEGGPALARLESVVLPPGEVDRSRAYWLKRIRPMPDVELEKLAARWRKSRSARLLGQLYDLHIGRMRPGTVRMKDLILLLGRPDVGDERDCHYHPNEGTALYLQGDAKGYLHAHSFT